MKKVAAMIGKAWGSGMLPLLIGGVLVVAGCAPKQQTTSLDEVRRRAAAAHGEAEGRSQPAGDRRSGEPSTPSARASSSARPAWVDRRPQDNAYYHGVSSSTQDAQDARQNALADLASAIEVHVESEIRSITRDQGYSATGASEYSWDTQREVQVMARATISEPDYAGEWTDGRRYWAYVRVSKEALRRKLEEELNSARRLALEHLTAGGRAEQRQRPGEALRSYLRGLAELRRFLSQPITAPHGGREVVLQVELETSAKSLMTGMSLEALPPTSRQARPGRPLAEGLSVVLKHQGRPLADVPISFVLEKGQGDLVASVRTDQSGKAESKVYRITSEAQDNTVAAAIDKLLMATGDAQDQGGSGAMLARVGGATVRFYISTKQQRIAVQIEETDLGMRVPDSYLARLVKGKLGELGASFVDSPSGASMLIRGTVETSPGSEMGGVFFCYADVSVALVDLASGEERYSKRLARVKGVDNSQERAARRALEKAAKQVADELSSYVRTETGP